MDKSMLGDLDNLPEQDKLRMSSMIDQLQIRDRRFVDMMGDGIESEAKTLQEQLRSNPTQLYAEHAILERIVYKNKNQHRHSSYFKYLLKVRRDLKLFRTVRLEDLLSSCFQVIIGDNPKQRIYHLESLKKGARDGGKPNLMESLLGAARLLVDMVEPMLKAACEISVLLARTFFMAFSLIVLALLARLRVLVQQILLDLVLVFNMVSSISQEKQSAKLTRKGIEVVREYYPLTRDYLTLECVWVTDKYTLLEKTCRIEDDQLKESCGDVPSVATEVQYHSIECLLEDEPVPAMELQKAEKTVWSFLFQSESQSGLPASATGDKILLDQREVIGEAGDNAVVTQSSGGEFLHGGSPTHTPATLDIHKDKTETKRVVFVSVKRPSLSASADSKPKAKRNRVELPAGSDDPFFNILTGGHIQNNLF